MSGMELWFSYDSKGEFMLHESEESAHKTAWEDFNRCDEGDGYLEGMDQICWGKIIGISTLYDYHKIPLSERHHEPEKRFWSYTGTWKLGLTEDINKLVDHDYNEVFAVATDEAEEIRNAVK